jgi:predicted metal-dependent enzyme (double-stranded beta helix superfamily)
MSYSHDAFVEAARIAAASGNPTAAIRGLLAETLADPAAVAAALPPQDEDEIILFEDETVSVWSSRFQPHVIMPPHEHRMTAHIGVIFGVEKELLFRRENGRLIHVSDKAVRPREVLSLGPDAIHAVTAAGNAPSHALHVYTGALSAVERSLFDWETGDPVPFTMENFHAMQRPLRD